MKNFDRKLLIAIVVTFMFSVCYLLMNVSAIANYLNEPVNITMSRNSYYFDNSSDLYKCKYAALCYEERQNDCSSIKLGCLSCCIKKY
jgi:hypothetical protein